MCFIKYQNNVFFVYRANKFVEKSYSYYILKKSKNHISYML